MDLWGQLGLELEVHWGWCRGKQLKSGSWGFIVPRVLMSEESLPIRICYDKLLGSHVSCPVRLPSMAAWPMEASKTEVPVFLVTSSQKCRPITSAILCGSETSHWPQLTRGEGRNCMGAQVPGGGHLGGRGEGGERECKQKGVGRAEEETDTAVCQDLPVQSHCPGAPRQAQPHRCYRGSGLPSLWGLV